MNPKTDVAGTETSEEKKSEFSPMFLRWIISLTIATLLFAFLGNYITPRDAVMFSPVPWTMAGGIVIEQGLELFSGHHLAAIPTERKIAMLSGLLMLFVLGPTLVLFSWRRLLTGPKLPRLNPTIIAFVVGVVFTSMGVLGTAASAIIHPMVAASMRSAQDLGENRDKVIEGMWRISVDAYQYKILPKSYGGGGGSYEGYQVPPALRTVETNEYSVVSASEALVTILGSSTKYPGAGIQGMYDRQGKLTGGFTFMGSFR